MPYFGPWIQDPDITVACGRNRALRDSDTSLGDVVHTGAYTLSDINLDVHVNAAPALHARTTNDLTGYAPAVAAAPVFTELNVNLTAIDLPSPSYHLFGSFTEEVLGCNADPHGWSVPFNPDAIDYEVEDDAEPVVVQGHVELVTTQTVNAGRTPDFSTAANIELYQYDAVDQLPTSGPALIDTHSVNFVDSGSAPTWTTVVDLTGAALVGVLFNPFIDFSPSSWSFSSGYQATDFLRQRVETDVDTGASFYVWRPPRYRYRFADQYPPARRLYPRDDSIGPGRGRDYPPPTTMQAGRRFGSGGPV